MKWLVREVQPNEVETDPTQKDQFDNDDAGLDDTLVREALQNSLDAAEEQSNPVRVRFRSITLADGLDAKYLRERFRGLEPHLQASGITFADLDFERPRVLVIEDFGTTGLIGAYDRKDEQNFSDFWRRHGRSHKGGARLGRWGLGKLVYSSSSRLSSFFGLTVRNGSASGLLMGQAVLNTRTMDGVEYAPHVFYGDEGPRGFQLPVTNTDEIAAFKTALCISRKDEPGLSIAIPYVRDELADQALVEVAILNYFFPILTGQLIVEVGSAKLDSDSIHELSKKYSGGKIRDAGQLFDFIQDSYTTTDESLVTVDTGWQQHGAITEKSFNPDALAKLREHLASQKLVGLRVPVTIHLKDGQDEASYYKLFLQAPEGLSVGQDLYVRGGITVPKESRFGDRRALGLLIAQDKLISGFLGDAENAAHVRWSSKAEKLLKNYKNPGATLKLIRMSLVQFHDLLAQALDRLDENALLDFFFAEAEGKPRPKGKVSPEKPKIDIPRTPRAFRISPRKGGFSVLPADPIASAKMPLEATLKVAYDLFAGNPFKRYSPIDFDVADLQLSVKGVVVTSRKQNELTFEIVEPEFSLEVTGFDDRRDIVVRAVAGDI